MTGAEPGGDDGSRDEAGGEGQPAWNSKQAPVTDIASWSTGSRTTTMPATAGTPQYSCSIHAGMWGSVQVQ
jgi:plastocyanin